MPEITPEVQDRMIAAISKMFGIEEAASYIVLNTALALRDYIDGGNSVEAEQEAVADDGFGALEPEPEGDFAGDAEFGDLGGEIGGGEFDEFAEPGEAIEGEFVEEIGGDGFDTSDGFETGEPVEGEFDMSEFEEPVAAPAPRRAAAQPAPAGRRAAAPAAPAAPARGRAAAAPPAPAPRGRAAAAPPAPAQQARRPAAAAAPAAAAGVDFSSMSATDLKTNVTNYGFEAIVKEKTGGARDGATIKAAYVATLTNFEKQVANLSAKYDLAGLIAIAQQKGVQPKMPQGRAGDEKKKRFVIAALAAARKIKI